MYCEWYEIALPRHLSTNFSPNTTFAASTAGVKGPSLAGPMEVAQRLAEFAEHAGAWATKPWAIPSIISASNVRMVRPSMGDSFGAVIEQITATPQTVYQ